MPRHAARRGSAARQHTGTTGTAQRRRTGGQALHRRPRVPAASPGQSFRGDVEGLRAVAVALVVAFHAGIGAVSGGYVGVDVFFVLSGFLITGLLMAELRRTGTVSLRNFWARRARRLLPMSTLVLVVTAVASYRILPPLDHGGVAADVRAAALYFTNWHFAAESTEYMADTDKSPVLHFWSLAVEEQFYLVWPLLLLVLVGRSRLARDNWPMALRRVALAVGVVGVTSFVLSATTSQSSGPFAYFGLHTRAWELALGAGLALAGTALGRVPRPVAVLAGWAGLALIVGSALTFDDTTVFPGTAAAVPVGGTGLLIVAGARMGTGGTSRLLAHPALRYVGRISYGWYLWHWPCLVLAAALGGAAATGLDEGEAPARTSAAVLAAAVVVSFVLAALSHRLLEEPIRHSRWLSAPRGRSLALGAALTAASMFMASGAVVAGFGQLPSGPVTTASLATATIEPIEPDPGAAPDPNAAASRNRPAADLALTGSVVLAPPDADRTSLTPEAARDDMAPNLRSCYNTYNTALAAKDCVYGDPEGDTVIALVGDSHAQHWSPALNRLAVERGWQLYIWGKAACPVQDTPVLKVNRSDYPGCTAWREELMLRLSELPRLDAVVVGRASRYDRLLQDTDGSRASEEDVAPIWEAASRRTFEELRRYADDVVVMRDIPQPGSDVPACLSENPRDLRRCDFPREGNILVDQSLTGAEERAAEGMAGVSFVDMTEEICPVDPCPAVTRDGTIMYRDDDHLSATFSERLWRLLGRELDPILAG